MKAKPFTFNTGTTISGSEQIGYIAYITGNTINQSTDYWYMGPDEDLGFIICKPKNFGLFLNGDFSHGNLNFSWGTVNTINQFSGDACLQYIGGNGGDSYSDNFVPVDTSDTYEMSLYARTLQRSTSGNLAGGYMGFACFDKNYNSIYMFQCGDIANTYLTRALNAGDSYAYVSNTNGVQWSSASGPMYARYFNIYPPTHPDYNQPYKYTRIAGDYDIRYSEITDIGGGELRIKFCNSSGTPITFPNIGYSTPINTPVCNGVDSSTFNYALGAPDYPETWTKYATPLFTGESRSGSIPFRYGTKYIKFLILKNYNHYSDSPNNAVWLLDNIYFNNSSRIY